MRARDNPFAADRLERIRYRFAGTSLDELLSRLEEMDYRAAIVGPEGSGKTTLLEDLRRALQHRGLRTKLLFVNDASPLSGPQCRRLLSELGPQELVLLDGADAIQRSSWLLLRRHTISRTAGLVITSHRHGLLPTLIECSTTPALLKEIVADLAPQGYAISAAQLDDLYTRHHGNLRTCLRELYDLYAERPPLMPITVEDLVSLGGSGKAEGLADGGGANHRQAAFAAATRRHIVQRERFRYSRYRSPKKKGPAPQRVQAPSQP